MEKWFKRGGSGVVKELLSPKGLLVNGVRVFRAAPTEGYGDGAEKYLAFRQRPKRAVRKEMEDRNSGEFVRDDDVDADTGAPSSSPSSSSSLSSSAVQGYYMSNAGMGKDEGDSNGADNKAKIRSKRGAGDGFECSDTLVAMGNSAPAPGKTGVR